MQPDYEKWQQLRFGMSEAEVISLLGPPLEKDELPPFFDKLSAEMQRTLVLHWRYGWIDLASPTVPYRYEFVVAFQRGEVDGIYNPFKGRFSKDGTPTVPVLQTPYDRTTLAHFPRFVDFRWSPSSGKYPIEYVLEVSWGQHSPSGNPDPIVEDGIEYHPETFRAAVPHHAVAFRGRAPGRWRVKARNRLGESEWSEFRYFSFSR